MEIINKIETKRIEYRIFHRGKLIELVVDIDEDGERHYDFLQMPEEFEGDEDEIIAFVDEEDDYWTEFH